MSSKIIYKVADVGDYDAVDAAVASAVEELGRIDVLINNVRNTLGHWNYESCRTNPGYRLASRLMLQLLSGSSP